MFKKFINNVRWKAASFWAGIGAKYAEKGGPDNICKGLTFMKYSIMCLPNDEEGMKERKRVGDEIQKLIDEYSDKT